LILGVIRAEVLELREKFADSRRTEIVAEAAEGFSEEDLIRQEAVLISVTQGSYIKRTPLSAYRAQKRGGRGVQGMRTKDEDEVVDLLSARTLDHMLFFTDRGRVYGQRVYNLPETARDGRGLPMVNFLNLNAQERVTAILIVPDFEQAEYVTLLTQKGKIKRMQLAEFRDVRPSGIIAMNLLPGDKLGWARLTHGKDHFLIVTSGGKACRFTEEEVRPMGRAAAGVKAIRLAPEDTIAAFDVVEPDGELLVVSELGFGKRSPMSEFPPHGRNSQGVWALDHQRIEETGKVAAARVVHPDDQVSIMTSNGIIIRTLVKDIRQAGRATKGVKVVTPGNGDTVKAMARLSAVVEEKADAEAKADADASVTHEEVEEDNGQVAETSVT